MKNWKMNLKVLLPILMIALIGITASLIGNMGLKKVQTASERISGEYLRSIVNLDEMSKEFVTLQKLMLQHCIADDTGKGKVEKLMDVSREDITSLCDTYDSDLKSNGSQSERELFNQFSKQLKEYLDGYELAISMSKSGNNEGAIRWTNGKLTSMSDKMITLLDQMSEQNSKKISGAINEENNLYNSSKGITTGIFLCILVLVLFAILICRKYIIKPIKCAKLQLAEIVTSIQEDHGNLTKRVDVRSRDEVGQLVIGINVFIETLQNVLGNIKNNTDKMNSVVNNVASSISTANGSACDISSVMEELSATMEEVSATIATVNSDIEKADKEVNQIASASTEINDYAYQMKERAENLEKGAVQNQNATSGMITDISVALKKAIDNSKNVDQINLLTEEILSLSSRTNLLALNASIEAARAGEAGKGFAVVAEEIRKLSDATKETVNKIQAVNNMVINAEYDLVNNSNVILEYVNETVLPDYKNFVDTGRQYSKDAVYINTMMETFNNKTDLLNNMINSITVAMNDISKTSQDSAAGITNAAASTNSFVFELNSVSSNMNINQEIAVSLANQADKFQTE